VFRNLDAEAARFVSFGVVGAIGFLVDAGLLAALHHGVGLDPFSARALSIAAAAFCTWRLNRRLTFGASLSGQAIEGLRYAVVAGLTAGLNYLIYALALIVWPPLPPLAAVVIATAIAMGASYAGYSRFVFSASSAATGTPSSHRR
jgi:putative flippase GtrA